MKFYQYIWESPQNCEARAEKWRDEHRPNGLIKPIDGIICGRDFRGYEVI